jgi:hypothetical protein
MKTELVVALIAGVVALTSATGTIWSTLRSAEKTSENAKAIEQLKIEATQLEAKTRRQTEISKLSEPYARSAYDLQSRIYNIMKQNLVNVYLVAGTKREQIYVTNNTVYLVAQYFCWSELVRREIQFIDLGENVRTRDLMRLQNEVSSIWGTDKYSPLFRVFVGEQRAIGETLVEISPRGPECIGYGAFLRKLAPGVDPLIDALRADVEALSTGLEPAKDRLKTIQNALIDLLVMLDPDHLRFPAERRSKV